MRSNLPSRIFLTVSRPFARFSGLSRSSWKAVSFDFSQGDPSSRPMVTSPTWTVGVMSIWLNSITPDSTRHFFTRLQLNWAFNLLFDLNHRIWLLLHHWNWQKILKLLENHQLLRLNLGESCVEFCSLWGNSWIWLEFVSFWFHLNNFMFQLKVLEGF